MGGSMTKVLSGLYVGSVDNIHDDEDVMANCISHILVVQNSEYDVETSSSFRWLSIVMTDDDPDGLFKCVSRANDFIHAARVEYGGVLVCSDSGMSANIAIVAAYLMSLYRLSRSQSLAAIGGLKHGVNPVQPLQDQLDRFASGSVSSPSRPRASAQSENRRLLEKFGRWSQFDEDMHLLRMAIQSHESMNDFDLVRLSSDPASTTPNQKDSFTPDPVTLDANVPVPDDSGETFAVESDIGFTRARESELFPLDPSLVDPDHDFSSKVAWTVRQGRFAEDEFEDPVEIGLELTADDSCVKNECDDVPGAIPMQNTSLSGRAALARSRAAARSFQARSESHSAVSRGTIPLACSLAATARPRRTR